MKLTKKQQKFVELVKACKYLYPNEVNKTAYPDSLVCALIDRGVIDLQFEGPFDNNPKIVCLV